MRNISQPLHLKYRPDSFEEFIGSNATITSLQSIIQRDKGEVRVFLFTGPSGCGKTTLARIIAKELKCSDRDFQEYNSANVRGIDTIREIANNCRYAPLSGKIKIYLLDEIHKATNDAQNALLKLLEDTPSHVRFILCTTDPDKLLKTIKTRCSSFQVSSLKITNIVKLLDWVCEEEKVEVDQKVINKIAESCDGSPRQALVMLDQIIDIEDEEIAFKAILDSTIDERNILDLCRKLLGTGKRWAELSQILKVIDEEPEKCRYAILSYLSKVLLNNPSDRVAQMIDLFSDSYIYKGKAGLILSCYMVSKI
jgi:DNA polymerase-3 subunit gamma/tau